MEAGRKKGQAGHTNTELEDIERQVCLRCPKDDCSSENGGCKWVKQAIAEYKAAKKANKEQAAKAKQDAIDAAKEARRKWKNREYQRAYYHRKKQEDPEWYARRMQAVERYKASKGDFKALQRKWAADRKERKMAEDPVAFVAYQRQQAISCRKYRNSLDPEVAKARRREYHLRYIEKLKADPERLAAQKERNKENRRKSAQQHPGRSAEYSRKWRAAHPEKREQERQRMKEWRDYIRANEPEKYAEMLEKQKQRNYKFAAKMKLERYREELQRERQASGN